MPLTEQTYEYRLPTPGTALVEKDCLNCLARFEYIQKTKYRDFCCDRCKTQYHNRKKTSAIVTTNISLTKKLRRIRARTDRKEFLTNLVYQFARYKCGLPTAWGPDGRVYSEAISNTKLFGKEAQAENDKVQGNIYSDFMREAKAATDGRDIYCPLTLADTFGLHDEIKQAGLPAPERRLSRRKHQAKTTPAPPAEPSKTTGRPEPAPSQAALNHARIMSGLDRHNAIQAFREYVASYPSDLDREQNRFSDWAIKSGKCYPDDAQRLTDNVTALLVANDPALNL